MWIAAGVLVVAVVTLGVRSFLKPAPPRDPAALEGLLQQLRASGALTADAEVKVRAMAGTKKLEAIKVFRTQTRVGLKEALDVVEAMIAGELSPTPGPAEPAAPTKSTDDEVRELVARGEKVRAIALVRERTRVSLPEAIELVQAIESGAL
jgi:ribosomal protein L7/L12